MSVNATQGNPVMAQLQQAQQAQQAHQAQQTQQRPAAAEQAQKSQDVPKEARPQAEKAQQQTKETPKFGEAVKAQFSTQAKEANKTVPIQKPEPVVTAIQEKVENLFRMYPNGGVAPDSNKAADMAQEDPKPGNAMPRLNLQA